jgi:uncharacterized OB-fold protein
MTTVDEFLAAGAAILARTGAQDALVDEMRRRGEGGQLVLQRCGNCAYLRYPPAPVCPECLSPDTAWVTDPGVGAIWSYCVYHRAYSKEFADLVPYAVALVTLDSGPTLITNVVDVGPHELRIGQRGVAAPRALPGGGSLVYFTVTEQLPGGA